MRRWWIAFGAIMAKDLRAYYLKPPNISWGLIFPLAWAGMFLLRAGQGLASARELLPGLMVVSILFGTTSMLAVTVTFERRGRSFDRLLLAPIPLELLMLAKTIGAILFGVVNALAPLAMAALVVDLSGIDWRAVALTAPLIAVASTFLGLLVAVSVTEVFEAQTLSNFFRFPMMFLCGLFVPVSRLPVFLRPLSYALPLTYGADALHGAIDGVRVLPLGVNLAVLAAFCVALFWLSLRNVRRRWIV
ncbi:MAG: ABC transporter permease [Anaerolineae bacterium]|jgi:ABC-2 type transport system permease protein